MKLLDTTFLIDLLRGKRDALAVLDTKETFLTTQINMFEVIRGLFLQKTSSSHLPEILELFGEIRVLPLDEKAIIESAKISAELYSNGRPIDDSDCLIAGIALSHGVEEIITKDLEHFKRIKKIKAESY